MEAKRRLIIAGMIFVICFINYLLRTNMNIVLGEILLSEMSELVPARSNNGPRFDWPSSIYDSTISAFYCGYAITSLIGGILADIYGGKNVIGLSILTCSFITMIHPVALCGSYYITIMLRFLVGLSLGFCYPACHSLISKWSPPHDKVKFLLALMGGPFSTIIIYPFTTLFIEYFDWRIIFYVEGIISLIIVALWFTVVTDNPATNRFIPPEEIVYINQSIVNTVTDVKKMPPFRSIFTSISYISLIFLHFGNIWGLTFIINFGPKYFAQVFESNINAVNYISMLPNFMRFIMAIIFAIIVDMIRHQKMLSVTKIRQVFCLTSHILPSLIIFVMVFWVKEPYMILFMMTLSLGFNGSAIITNIQNCHDLAPNYAGTLFGIMNFVGNTSGFFGTMVKEYLTKNEITTKGEWDVIIFVDGSVYLFTSIVYIFWGSGTIQNWNYNDNDEIIKEVKDIK